MSSQANYTKIGIFVLAAIALGVAAVVVLGAGAVFEEKTIVETYFDGSVQGLEVGSPVKFRGMRIGKVASINVAANEYPTDLTYIVVRMSITSNYFWTKDEKTINSVLESAMERGLRARLAQQGLTGSAYVEVDYLDPERNPVMEVHWEPRYPYLASAPSVITQLSESLTRIMTSLEKLNLQGLMGRLEKLLDSVTGAVQGADLENVSDEAHALLSELRETNRNLNKLVSSADLRRASRDASAAMSEARTLVEETRRPWKQTLASVKETSENVNRLSRRLDKSVEDLPAIIEQLQTTLRRIDNLAATPQRDLEDIMENLRQTTENLKEISEDSKKHPSRLFFGEPPNRARPGGR